MHVKEGTKSPGNIAGYPDSVLGAAELLAAEEKAGGTFLRKSKVSWPVPQLQVGKELTGCTKAPEFHQHSQMVTAGQAKAQG